MIWSWIPGNLGLIGQLTRQNAYIGIVSAVVGLVIAVPLGIVSLTSAWRSIPTLGLLVLLVVVLGFSALTWLVPLIVLGIPPILVNAYAGVAGVDPGLRDAAAGVGMTRRQQVLQVEVPVALPLIIVGLRTAAIFIVSTATIAAYIGLGGLGRYIFDGLANNNYGEVAGGAVLVVLLALAVLLLSPWCGAWRCQPGSGRNSVVPRSSALRRWKEKNSCT